MEWPMGCLREHTFSLSPTPGQHCLCLVPTMSHGFGGTPQSWPGSLMEPVF